MGRGYQRRPSPAPFGRWRPLGGRTEAMNGRGPAPFGSLAPGVASRATGPAKPRPSGWVPPRMPRSTIAFAFLLGLGACGGPARQAGERSVRGPAPEAPGRSGLRCEDPPEPTLPRGRGPASLRLRVTRIPPGPVGLGQGFGVWSGRAFLIFGGAEPEVPPPAGARSPGDHGRWVESPGAAGWAGVAGHAFDPDAGSWRALPGALPADSTALDSAAWHCGAVFGITRSGTAYRYDPEAGTTTTVAPGAPAHCQGPRIATRGTEAMIFGCGGCEGHVYDAATDTWRAMGHRGDPIDWTGVSCAGLPTAVAGDRFVVLRRYRGVAGGAWNLRTGAWERVAEDGSPEQITAGPVSDGRAVYVVGQRGSRAGIYRYDLERRAWAVQPLPGVCGQGTAFALRDGVLVEAGGAPESGDAVCGYDLVHGAALAGVSPFPEGRPTVTVFGGDRVMLWAQRRGTGHGAGEMPRTPTHWIDDAGWLVDVSVRRP